MHIHSLAIHHHLARVLGALLASAVETKKERVVAMATTEVSIQMAGVLDGQPGCALSRESLVVRAVPRTVGASLMEAADEVAADATMTKDAAAAAHDETRCSVSFSVPGSPSGLHLAQLGMPPLVFANQAEVGAPAEPASV